MISTSALPEAFSTWQSRALLWSTKGIQIGWLLFGEGDHQGEMQDEQVCCYKPEAARDTAFGGYHLLQPWTPAR